MERIIDLQDNMISDNVLGQQKYTKWVWTNILADSFLTSNINQGALLTWVQLYLSPCTVLRLHARVVLEWSGKGYSVYTGLL